jgi:O-antigen ligase
MVLAWRAATLRIFSPSEDFLCLPRVILAPVAFGAIAMLQWGGGLLTFGGNAMVIFFYAFLCVASLSLGFTQCSTTVAEATDQHPPDLLLALAWCLLAAAVCSAFIGFCQVFQLWETAEVIARMGSLRRPGGNLGQTNHLATLLVIGMASAVYLQLRQQWTSGTTALIALFLGAGIAATESRTGLLSLLALSAWWLWKQPHIAPRMPRSGAIGLTAAMVAMFLFWPTLFNAVHMMGDGAIESRLSSLNDTRLAIWAQLGEAALLKPWWGWGINQTAQAHHAVAHLNGASAPFTFAHNLLLDLALWVGLPLTGVFMALAATWAWRRTTATRALTPWYGLAVALPVAVHSMLEYPFAYAYFLVPVMLGIGVAEGALGGRVWLRLRPRTAGGLLLVTTSLMAWSVAEYIKAEEDYRVARFEMLRIGATPSAYERPNIAMLTQLGALLEGIRLPLTSDMPASDLELLRAVALTNPLPTVKYRYAMALALNERPADATRQIQVLRAQHGEIDIAYFCDQLRHALQEKNAWQPECALAVP